MKKRGMQKNKWANGMFGDREIMYGKGKEYSEVSRELESAFHAWLSYAGMDEAEFDLRMSVKPHKVEECVNENGEIEINIYAGFKKAIAPLLFRPSGGGADELDNFLVNALLLLYFVASRYEDKSFEREVRVFADRMIKDRKMTLG